MPKQFTRLVGDQSMLQQTAQRLEDVGCDAPIFVTNNEHRFTVAAQADDIGLTKRQIVIEPQSRNTAAAICAASELLMKTNPSALILIAPADHHMPDSLGFSKAVAQAVNHARDGHVVTFGIQPDRAETGFGYIEIDHNDTQNEAIRSVISFVEKPDQKRADILSRDGRHLWNSGMFLLSAATAQNLFETHAPQLRHIVNQSVETAKEDLEFLRLGSIFERAPTISFDHAIMEKTDASVVPLNINWSDLGTWHSVWENCDQSTDGVATLGTSKAFDCEDSLLLSDDDAIQIVGVGLKNIAAVATRDAVLITDLNSGQSMSHVVSELRNDHIRQAEEFHRSERPWGHYETLARGPRFQVKSIVVKPGAKLSLQSHVHRAEHWVVVEGTAAVHVDGTEKLITENQSIYVPLGAIHRLSNQGKVPLKLIEVQTGTYLEEDDILRYEDIYQRA
jgi:mannose-1-phosphate guanylyltransferase/mannose-6-phosphate isomerase